MESRAASRTWIGNWNRSPRWAWYCLDQSGLLRSDLVRVWFDSGRPTFIHFDVVNLHRYDLILKQLVRPVYTWRETKRIVRCESVFSWTKCNTSENINNST